MEKLFLPLTCFFILNNKLKRPSVSVKEFLDKAPKILELRVVTGAEGLSSRTLTSTRIQKLGLALTGLEFTLHRGRLQLIGQSEIDYLKQLTDEKRKEAINNLALDNIPCLLVTRDIESPEELIETATRLQIPLLVTPLISSLAISTVVTFLQETLAPYTTEHGVMLDMYGLGVMLTGDSGMGKSECALDLISRGHRLVSDDVIELRRIGDKRIFGNAPELLKELLEIRGLGIINIRDLFSVSAISDSKELSLCIRLERWDEHSEVDRLGIDRRTETILDVEIPLFVIPVSPARNLAMLVETAVRVHLLRLTGTDSARNLVEKHTILLEKKERESD